MYLASVTDWHMQHRIDRRPGCWESCQIFEDDGVTLLGLALSERDACFYLVCAVHEEICEQFGAPEKLPSSGRLRGASLHATECT